MHSSLVARRTAGAGLPLVLVLLLVAVTARADTVLTDFSACASGSYNPRCNWSAFGAGTSDRGVRADGYVGNAAYHSVNWGDSSWGIGDVYGAAVDLSAYGSISIAVRVVDMGNWTGTPLLNFALNLPNDTEYSTPTVAVTSTYQVYTFNFADLVRTAGSGALDLTQGTPKFILRKNGQTGAARFDFDEITLAGSGGGGYELTPVVLNPPWDGDAVRAMWLYCGGDTLRFDSVTASQALLDFCAREGVNRLYIGAYSIWAGTSDELKANLRTFLHVAHASGIRCEALLDGTTWQNYPSLVQTRIAQILTLHNATPGDTTDDFDAIHFDVEFWLDDSWKNTTEDVRQGIACNYLDHVLVNARDYLDAQGGAGVAIAVDLSAHFDTSSMLPSPMLYDGVTQYFVEHVLDHVDDLVYMSYYDTVGALLNTIGFELDRAAAQGRTVQLGADVQTGENPINTFADNLPTPYAAMTMVLQSFHQALSASRLAALDGFSVFHYDGYTAYTPNPRNVADMDGDADLDGNDLQLFLSYLTGPNTPATSVKRDADFDLSGTVDLRDVASFGLCFSGTGTTPQGCER